MHIADPTCADNRPVIATVDKLAHSGQLQTWPRPAVPQLNTLVRILGKEIHTMLLRNKKPSAALRDAQARCEKAIATSEVVTRPPMTQSERFPA